jgi:hypothetical protein
MDSRSYSKGISWINDVRIPFVDEGDKPNDMDKTHLEEDRLWNGVKGLKPFLYQQNTTGRFPANLLVSDDALNDGVISKSNDNKWIGGMEKNWKGHTNKRIHSYTDKGTNSRYYDLDKWFEKLLEDV